MSVINIDLLAVLRTVTCVAIIAVVCIRADKELLCLVCNAVVEEMELEIGKVKPGLKLQVGNFRMDPSGSQIKSEMEYARSETHLNDVLDGFCERMEGYAEAHYKKTRKRIIMKLTRPEGGLHPDIGDVDFVQDGELNKKLKFYCETIIEEYEDDIMIIFAKKQEDSAKQLCVQAAGFCLSPEDEDEDGGEEEIVAESVSAKDEL